MALGFMPFTSGLMVSIRDGLRMFLNDITFALVLHQTFEHVETVHRRSHLLVSPFGLTFWSHPDSDSKVDRHEISPRSPIGSE